MTIPKIIHYCWFGGNEEPDDVKRCICSWKKLCPEYEIFKWDESNFDINCNEYVKESYQMRKYAFVSDYVRLFALYNYGGIYLDTDVEVIKNLDLLLNQSAFFGFETEKSIATCIIGSEQHNDIILDFLNEYQDIHFIVNGKMDMTTNVTKLTDLLQKKGLKLNNILQMKEEFTVYPIDFFNPKNYKDGKIYITKNTYIIHHFSGTWQTTEQKKDAYFSRKYGNIGKYYYVIWLLFHSPKKFYEFVIAHIKKIKRRKFI